MAEEQPFKSACPHPEAEGTRWGDPISAKRQAELKAILDAWNAPVADHSIKRGPFDNCVLNAAEVFWLAAQAASEQLGTPATTEHGLRQVTADVWHALHPNQAIRHSFSILNMSRLNLSGAILRDAHLEAASLAMARFQGADLRHAYLEAAVVVGTHFESANLVEANLRDTHGPGVHLDQAQLHSALIERANFSARGDQGPAHLDSAVLWNAQLAGTCLDDAYCEAASFRFANLNGAQIERGRLERADLTGASLEGTNLLDARMEHTTLRSAFFDQKTNLRGATLASTNQQGPVVVDVRWGNANLAVIDLDSIWTLGDERIVKEWKASERNQDHDPRQADAAGLSEALLRAVRANRQFAVALRSQGLNEAADRFGYRAQILQRRAFYLKRRRWRWMFWCFLGGLAGYGYRPEFTLGWYAFVLALSAGVYCWQGAIFAHPGTPGLAILGTSIVDAFTALHGRGFFPTPAESGWQMGTAAFDAVAGLLIEASFIATFTQRFFAR